MALIIRRQQSTDDLAVFQVNAMVFNTEAEANLVNRVRKRDLFNISLVAELDGKIVGHLLMSMMHANQQVDSRFLGIAPMAVLPVYQKQGVGKQLMTQAIKIAVDEHYDAIFVVGNLSYYSKFGFVLARQLMIANEYGMPDDIFMVLDLFNSGLPELRDKAVGYHKLFSEL